MTYVRINNIELNSESDLYYFEATFKYGKFREMFPESEILMSIGTEPNSVVSVSTYPN